MFSLSVIAPGSGSENQRIKIGKFQLLVTISRAAMTPGTQPQQVSMNTSNTEPQPLSMTARGGNRIQRITLRRDIVKGFSIR